MLLLLTATADETGMESEDELQEKALLDTEELQEVDSFSVSPSDKVELDLDDAPFLEEEEDEEPEEVYEEARDESLPTGEEAKPFYKERKFILIAAGAAILILILILTIAFWPESKPVEPQPDEPETTQEVEAAPTKEPFVWDPFVVELKDREGNIRFLYIQISAETDQEILLFELRRKSLQIRDAVYYYLKNKDISYLDDKTNEETLKNNLLSVINQHLGNGQLDELFIGEYLVK